MSISDKAKKALLELGLTHYEIKVYVTLLSQGYLTASEVSKISKIPFSKVYDVLSNLQNKGFVRVEESRPAKYYPTEPIYLHPLEIKLPPLCFFYPLIS